MHYNISRVAAKYEEWLTNWRREEKFYRAGSSEGMPAMPVLLKGRVSEECMNMVQSQKT